MKPEEVHFRLIRDAAWRGKWCAICRRQVPYFHDHHGRAARVAAPEIATGPALPLILCPLPAAEVNACLATLPPAEGAR